MRKNSLFYASVCFALSVSQLEDFFVVETLMCHRLNSHTKVKKCVQKFKVVISAWWVVTLIWFLLSYSLCDLYREWRVYYWHTGEV